MGILVLVQRKLLPEIPVDFDPVMDDLFYLDQWGEEEDLSWSLSVGIDFDRFVRGVLGRAPMGG